MNSSRAKLSLSRRLIVSLILSSLLLVVLHILLKYISIVIFDEKHGFLFELSNRFDLNDENSIPQWATQAIFLGIGGLAFLAHRFSKKSEGSTLWLTIAVFGVFLSIDDVATLHEFLLQSLHNTFFEDMASTLLTNAWMLLLPFIVIVIGLLVYKAYRLLPARTYLQITLGVVIYIIGAVIVDSLTNNYLGQTFIEQGVMGAIEGGMQLIGSSIFLYAVYDYLEKFQSLRMTALSSSLKQADSSKK